MRIETYLAIALITMEADALACYVSGVRYRVAVSAVHSILWPLAIPCGIVCIIAAQKKTVDAHVEEVQP